jgi:FkbM family methyltransferase
VKAVYKIPVKLNLPRPIKTLIQIFSIKSHRKVSLPKYLYYFVKSFLNSKGLFVDNRFELIDHKGTQILINSLNCTDISTYFEIFRYGEYDGFLKLVKEEKNRKFNVVDLGANIGLFAKFLEFNKIDVCKYVAVEPLPNNIKALQFNTQYKNTDIVTKAVWHHNRGVRFSTCNASNTNMISSKGGKKVPSISFSDVLSKVSSNDFIILKVDIEGAEYDLLKHNNKLINSSIDYIVIEFHNVTANTETEIKRMLPEFNLYFGYKDTSLLVVWGYKR